MLTCIYCRINFILSHDELVDYYKFQQGTDSILFFCFGGTLSSAQDLLLTAQGSFLTDFGDLMECHGLNLGWPHERQAVLYHSGLVVFRTYFRYCL